MTNYQLMLSVIAGMFCQLMPSSTVVSLGGFGWHLAWRCFTISSQRSAWIGCRRDWVLWTIAGISRRSAATVFSGACGEPGTLIASSSNLGLLVMLLIAQRFLRRTFSISSVNEKLVQWTCPQPHTAKLNTDGKQYG
ncbi:hypothetical protein L6164_034679 [Bauhinia variegata]|uniref:Uncharacterized protein n=1 Tax=Bauhinia variegata TaxID=167791 RepID=A0ACB9KW63_BAUVA|nr:hypothetical protein L6164_034679 [Bauhinia variegata]